MPRKRKSDRVPGKVQDLAPRNTTAREADKIKGGSETFLSLVSAPPPLEKKSMFEESLGNMTKQTSQANGTIVDNLKG